MKYKVYRQKIISGKIVDEIVATCFTEHDAKSIVKGIRAEQHNQLAFYKKEE